MRSNLTILLRLLSPFRWRYGAGMLALSLSNLLQQVLPWATGRFFTDLQALTLTSSQIWRYLGLIVGAAILITIARFLWRYFIFGTALHVERNMRARLFAHLEQLSASFYHRHKTGDLMAMAINDLQAVRAMAGEGVLMLFDSIFITLVTTAVMISAVGWRLSLLALLPLPLLAVAVMALGRITFVRSRAVQDAFGHLSDVVQENVSGVRVVKAFGQEAIEEQKFQRANRHYLVCSMALTRVRGAVDPLIQLLAGLCFALALLFPGRAVLRNEIPIGAFVSLTMYIGMLIWPMLATGWVINMVQRGLASLARIQEVLSEPAAVISAPHAIMPAHGTIQGKIAIRNLTFTYDQGQAPALHQVTLSLQPGQTLGILGRTGSGKSTLLSLLARLFDPPRGSIFIDGIDVLDLPLQELRQAIAFVPQESFLFSRTIGENIAFAPGEWTVQSIQQAARIAQVEADILEFLPDGYATLVGERGVTLSGGQRQRVGLSRAVLKEAPILVLDDCLSAVDTATEARILEGLRRVMRARTTLIISHRIAALKEADHIIVLEKGRCVEAGTHAELLALGGRYAQTHRRQQLEEAIASGT